MEKTKRTCLRCGTEMVENCYVCVTGSYGLTIKVNSDKLFDPNLGTPYIAVCPSCGEISWYVPPQELHLLKQ